MFDAPTLAEGQVIGNGDVRQVAYGNDAGLYVEFSYEDVYLEAKSQEEGRPIYEQRPFISIYAPGDKTKKVVREVRTQWFGDTPPDTERFSRQWAAFQQGEKVMATGLPLKEWPLMTSSQVKELNGLNIYTVEQLAEVPDASLDSLGHGGRATRDKAKAHLARMGETAATDKLAEQNADLQRQLDELRASLSPDAPRRGRPPKERTEEDV